MTSPETPTSVGQQLKARRLALDLTQPALAGRIGIDPSTVSTTERGLTEIQRSKRSGWEHALQLKQGTISRAYTDGSPLEPAEPRPEEPPYADLSNPKERAVWNMDLSEADRREIIDAVRAMAQQRNQQQQRRA